VLIAAAPGASVATATASGGLPPSIYPPPLRSRGALPACPNPAGLQPFNRNVTSAAVASANRYLQVSEAVDLHNSDPAWWPQVRAMWRRRGQPQPGLRGEVVDKSEPLRAALYSVLVRSSCGGSLVAKSLLVMVGPRHQRCAACRSNLFFLDRRGHALLYYTY
jgi:hypothetical protein